MSWQFVPSIVEGIFEKPVDTLISLYADIVREQNHVPNVDLECDNIDPSSVPLLFWFWLILETFRHCLKDARNYLLECANACGLYASKQTAASENTKRVRRNNTERANLSTHTSKRSPHNRRLTSDIRVRRLYLFLRTIREARLAEFVEQFFQNIKDQNDLFLDYVNHVSVSGLQFPRLVDICETSTAAGQSGANNYSSASMLYADVNKSETELCVNVASDKQLLLLRIIFLICRSWAEGYFHSVRYFEAKVINEYTAKVQSAVLLLVSAADKLIEGLIKHCDFVKQSATASDGTKVVGNHFPIAIALQILHALEPEIRNVLTIIVEIVSEMADFRKELEDRIAAHEQRASRAPKAARVVA